MTNTSTSKPAKELRIDFDTNWKEFLHRFLPDFLRYYYPGLYRQIDWTRQPEFLEQELRLALRKKIGRKKISDVLVKVWLKTGEVKFILIHFEIQSFPDELTARRVYEYHSLISVNLGIEEITSIVLYTGEQIPAKHNKYEKRVFGTKVKFEFPTVVLSEEKEEKLLKTRNPVAIAVLANLWTLKTRKKPALRAKKKLQLLDILAKMKYPMEEFQDLLIFVKDLMPLSNKLESIVMKTSNIPVEYKGLPPRWQLKKTKSNQLMVDLIYKYAYGYDPEELRQDRLKLEHTVRLLEEKAQQVLISKRKSIRLLFEEFHLSPQEISEKLEIPLDEVKKLLPRRSKKG